MSIRLVSSRQGGYRKSTWIRVPNVYYCVLVEFKNGQGYELTDSVCGSGTGVLRYLSSSESEFELAKEKFLFTTQSEIFNLVGVQPRISKASGTNIINYS